MNKLIKANAKVLLKKQKLAIYELNQGGIDCLTEIVNMLAKGLGQSLIREF